MKRQLLRTAVCVFCLYHMHAMLLANLFEVNPLAKALRGWVDPYLTTLVQWQEWDMFTTIPLYLDIQSTLVARDGSGAETRYGPMLPGFTPPPDNLRIVSMAGRLVWVRHAFPAHVNRHHRAACAAITRASGAPPQSVRIELDAKPLRSLERVAATGVIADSKVFRSGNLPCPR